MLIPAVFGAFIILFAVFVAHRVSFHTCTSIIAAYLNPEPGSMPISQSS